MNKIRSIILAAITVIMVISCTRREKQDVLLLYPNWADGIAITHLAKIIMEDKGYTVTVKRLEPGPIFATISRGDADIYMDAWLPYTHKEYWARFGKRLDIIGTTFDDGITGLVVPDYVPVNSIEELNANKEKFQGNIYGISSGAGIYQNTQNVIQEYKLDYKQIASSETSMITTLKKAESQRQWIIITGWKPHFMWTHFNLKVLDDPKKVYPVDKIQTIARKGFKEDKPELAEFFKKFQLDEKLLNELMVMVSEDKDPDIGAREFYLKHKDILQLWLEKKAVVSN